MFTDYLTLPGCYMKHGRSMRNTNNHVHRLDPSQQCYWLSVSPVQFFLQTCLKGKCYYQTTMLHTTQYQHCNNKTHSSCRPPPLSVNLITTYRCTTVGVLRQKYQEALTKGETSNSFHYNIQPNINSHLLHT
jgi:hypothetical protein